MKYKQAIIIHKFYNGECQIKHRLSLFFNQNDLNNSVTFDLSEVFNWQKQSLKHIFFWMILFDMTCKILVWNNLSWNANNYSMACSSMVSMAAFGPRDQSSNPSWFAVSNLNKKLNYYFTNNASLWLSDINFNHSDWE